MVGVKMYANGFVVLLCTAFDHDQETVATVVPLCCKYWLFPPEIVALDNANGFPETSYKYHPPISAGELARLTTRRK